jgi:histidyl-tRNA synthetase
MKAKAVKFPEESLAKVFLSQLGSLAKRKSLKLFEEFRRAKILVIESFGRDSLKNQLNRANRLGIKYVLILGQKEALEGTIIIKDMDTGKQETIKIEKVVGEIKKRLKK